MCTQHENYEYVLKQTELHKNKAQLCKKMSIAHV